MSKDSPFAHGETWEERVLSADVVWGKVKAALEETQTNMPKLSRRPDVRLILNNTSGKTVMFQNPGDHSGGKPEEIPGTGDKTAAMVMLAGDTLEEQLKNAEALSSIFDLSSKGLSPAFVQFLAAGAASKFVDEAYGPAPYGGQSEKLVDLKWQKHDGDILVLPAVFGEACSYGARPPTEETAFLANVPLYFEGTETVPEIIESDGIVVAVSQHRKTKVESTRPIVTSVARGFYGKSFDDIPTVVVDPDGEVHSIFLDGELITRDPEGGEAVKELVTATQPTNE